MQYGGASVVNKITVSDMASLTEIFLCWLSISPILVAGFTFPGDWHKIRQMMITRRDKEKLNEEIVTLLDSV